MSKGVYFYLCLSLLAIVVLVQRHISATAPAPATMAANPVSRPVAVVASSPGSQMISTDAAPVAIPDQTQSDALAQYQFDATKTAAMAHDDPTPDLSEELNKLRTWAAKDPEKALAEVMKLPDCPERNQALLAVCYGIAQNDPAAAINVAQTLKLDQLPVGFIPNVLQQWANTDSSSALAWAINQPAGDQRNEFTQAVAYGLARSQPSDAIVLVQGEIPSGSAQDKAMLTVLDQWANQDIGAAITYANGFPDGPLRKEALEGLEHRRLAAQ